MNPILGIARAHYTPQSDVEAFAAEWLTQMERLWSEHTREQFPYAVPEPRSAPVPIEDTLQTGEDSEYWDAVLALWQDHKPPLLPNIDPEDQDTQNAASEWRDRFEPDGYDPVWAMAHIRQAAAVFNHLYQLTKEA